MQKVEGSSPFIRSSESPALAGFFFGLAFAILRVRSALESFWKRPPPSLHGRPVTASVNRRLIPARERRPGSASTPKPCAVSSVTARFPRLSFAGAAGYGPAKADLVLAQHQ